MYTTNGVEKAPLTVSPLARVVATALAGIILILGVYPRPLEKVLTPPPSGVVEK
jgi:hypothetical protein